MKRYLISIWIVMLASFILASCTTTRYPTLNVDWTKESWMQEVPTSSAAWAQGADKWFLDGGPNKTEMTERRAPYSEAISTMSIKVPDFTNIQVKGDFQVQIFGTYEHNSVYIYGPNDVVRQMQVGVKGNTLFLGQVQKFNPIMNKVIVRIGIRRLNHLIQAGGCATIEGIQLRTNWLSVRSSGRGNIYLSGNMNLKDVTSTGLGTVSVFGAVTPALNITTAGGGDVNVIGNVGVACIEHHGRNNINIIGANSDGLKIFADGAGKVAINGHANLKEVHTRGNVRVYLTRSESDSIYAYTYNNSVLGIAGRSVNFYANTYQTSKLQGRYLCVQNAFVRSFDWSHINISACSKIFASATQQSSIYFFGAPNVLSQFVSGSGVVIPIWGMDIKNGCSTKPVPPVPYQGEIVRASFKGESYKGENYKGEYTVPRHSRNSKVKSYKVTW